MSITDKTRKVLWGRSGNLCAFCKAHLVVDASALDAESVVGDECHIVSGAPSGPRHDPTLAPELIDSLANLLLLCRVHHKLVDDQPETFTADTLRQLKANHEKWVKDRLGQSVQPEPVRVVRTAAEIPTHLVLVTSAKSLLDLASDCHERYDDYPDDLTETDLDCVGAFLHNLTDWVDLGLHEPHERISAQRSLAENMSELDQAGLRVYVAREKQLLRGGAVAPSAFYALHLRIVRHDDPNQISLATQPED
ncbi:HNH endonuclease signature motif containing protein [Marilutibacter maris]|uniref:HNH endonuclease signature motif containing protein n=1 Tax=Marilutibacter maris TaxID=1605891 RepID=UPI000DAA9724|nr:HNH endonuclease signature motif containing protein [Lysobacter maris]